MASHGDDLSFRTLNAITYLDATIKEVVRLIPASNFMIRQLAQPLTVRRATLLGHKGWKEVHVMESSEHCRIPPGLASDVICSIQPAGLAWGKPP